MFTPAQALGKAAQWKELSSKGGYYSQTGTDPNFPTFSTGGGETYAAGSDFPPQRFEYDYFSPESLAAGMSFDINKRQGALGKRSGEQLLRLQQGSGAMENEKLLEELELRNIRPSGISLPLV